MPVTRTTVGLVASETFDAMAVDAPPPGWTVRHGVARDYTVQPAITGMSVRALNADPASTTDGESTMTRDDPVSLLDAVVQAKVEAGPGALFGDNHRPGLTLRFASAGAYVRAWASNWTFDTPEGLWLRVRESDPTVLQTATAAFNVVSGTVYTLQLSAIGTEARARLFSPAGALLVSASLSDINRVDPGSAGVYDIMDHRAPSVRWDDWRLFSGVGFTVVDLPTGWKARFGGVTVVGDGAGVAAFDLEGSIFPIAGTVEVLNEDDVVIDAINPTDGVWGGDIYTADFPVQEIFTEGARPTGSFAPAPDRPGGSVAECDRPVGSVEAC